MERRSRVGSVLAAFEQTIDKNRECGGLQSKSFLTGIAGDGAMVGSVTPKRFSRKLSLSPGKSPANPPQRTCASAPTSARSPINASSGHSACRKSRRPQKQLAVNAIKSPPFASENAESKLEKTESRTLPGTMTKKQEQSTAEQEEKHMNYEKVQAVKHQRQIELVPNPYLQPPIKTNDNCNSPVAMDTCSTTSSESSSVASLKSRTKSHKGRQRFENLNLNSSATTVHSQSQSIPRGKSPKRHGFTVPGDETVLASSNHSAAGRNRRDESDHRTKPYPASPKSGFCPTKRMLHSDQISLTRSPARQASTSRKQVLSTSPLRAKHPAASISPSKTHEKHFSISSPYKLASKSHEKSFNTSSPQLRVEYASPTKLQDQQRLRYPVVLTAPSTPLTPSFSPVKRGFRNSVFQGLDKVEPAVLGEPGYTSPARPKLCNTNHFSPRKLAQRVPNNSVGNAEHRLINTLGLATPKRRNKFAVNHGKIRQMNISDIILEESSVEGMAMDDVEVTPKFVLEYRARQTMKLQTQSAVIIQAFLRGSLLRRRKCKLTSSVRIQAIVRGGMERLKFRIALLEHKLITAEAHRKKDMERIQLNKWKDMEACHAAMAKLQEQTCEAKSADFQKIIDDLKQENAKIQDQNNRTNNMIGLLTQMNEQTEKATETHNLNFNTMWGAVELLTEEENKLTARIDKYKMRIDKQMASLVALGARVKNETRVRKTLEKSLVQIVETFETRSDDKSLVNMIVALSNGEYEEEESITIASDEPEKEEEDIDEGFFLSFCITDDVSDVSSIHNGREEVDALSLEPVPYDEVEYEEEVLEDDEDVTDDGDDEMSCQSSVWDEQQSILL